MADIVDGLAFAVGTLTAEHMISAGLSSPWSVAKFAASERDKRQVWKLFFEATAASIILASVTGWVLGGRKPLIWSILGVLAISGFVGWEYHRALNGQL